VFFVKSPDDDEKKDYDLPDGNLAGIKLVVQFFDGEEIVGTSFDYSLKKSHFFLFPTDADDNNRRILVNRKAARFISRITSEDAGRSGEDDITFRKRFEREVYRYLYSLAQQFADLRLPIDNTLVINNHLAFKKEFGHQVKEYRVRFGDDVWLEFLARKMQEIEFDMGDRALIPLTKIVGLSREQAEELLATPLSPA